MSSGSFSSCSKSAHSKSTIYLISITLMQSQFVCCTLYRDLLSYPICHPLDLRSSGILWPRYFIANVETSFQGCSSCTYRQPDDTSKPVSHLYFAVVQVEKLLFLLIDSHPSRNFGMACWPTYPYPHLFLQPHF